MELLRHSEIGVTIYIYSHVMPAQIVQAADAMENVLWARDSSYGYFHRQERRRAPA
ncbi:hypothetical protein ACSNN7_16885 [Micromonospora sp. URMC 105]|uniref:hypothetical protein n=1 Tax=Micromonospora sp. URMC 105 TaxID=3423413 RepID=UPI003F1DCA26